MSTSRVASSERVISEHHELSFVPTKQAARQGLGTATVTLRAIKRRQIEFQLEALHQAVRVESRGGKLAASIFWLGAGGVAIVAVERRRDETSNNLTLGDKWMGAGGGLSLLLGFAYFVDVLGETEPEVLLGRTLRGDQVTQREFVDAGPVSGARVIVGAAGLKKPYTTDFAGELEVSLPTEFGITYFEQPTILNVAAWLQQSSDTLSLSIPVADIFPPCVHTRGRGIVQQQPSAAAASIGQFGVDEVFALLDDTPLDYYGIAYRGATGYISRQAAVLCWGVRP